MGLGLEQDEAGQLRAAARPVHVLVRVRVRVSKGEGEG